MSTYPLTWITDNLAVGHAPMSYVELDSLKEQGIDAIVNLCGEFCDLHEIEETAGFEVFFLPIPDETAPDMVEMEKALAWLDEAIYLGKNVLVHCRHGIGRTGTFVTAYLLRRGFSLKNAGKMLKSTRANPTNFSQWWLLRKFGKKEGQLTLSQPTTDNRTSADLSRLYSRYEHLLEKIDALTSTPSSSCCVAGVSQECSGTFTLELIEALYLNNKVNISLSAGQRQSVIQQAAGISQEQPADTAETDDTASATARPAPGLICPLRQGDTCLLHRFRPIHCRLTEVTPEPAILAEIHEELAHLSREVFCVLFGQQADQAPPAVSCPDTVSGKFIQLYFQYLASLKTPNERS